MTHPFHPLSGQKFVLIERRHPPPHFAAEERVYFEDQKGRLRSFPVSWTDLASVDPFVEFSRGRSAFRLVDLLRLMELLERLDEASPSARGRTKPVRVSSK